MNEQDDEILLTVSLDEGETEDRCKAINTQIKFLRDAAKGLEKDFKESIISQRQYDAALGRINDQSKKLSSELTVQTKALADSRKGIVANSGSLNEMQAKANTAKAEFLALTKAERENKDIGGELLKRVHDLNKEYDEQNKRLIQGKKSIGDYIKDTTVLGINVGETIEKFKAGGSGVLTFAKGIFSARGALVALTAIPIVLFLTALVSFLTKSQAGMDFLSRKTAGLSAVLQKLTGIVVEVGGKIFKAFEEGRAGAALLDTVVENITNRFTGLKVIAEGVINLDWRKIADGFIQVGTGVKDATGKATALATELNKSRKAGEAIALETQKIRDAEIALGVERSKNRAEIEKQKKFSEDITKSTGEREQAAKRAYALENSLLQKSIDLQQRKINNLKAEKKQGQETAETNQAIADEVIKLNELVEESTGKQTELQNNLNNIRLEGANNALAADKKAIDEQVAYYERALIQAKRNKQDTLDIEEAIIKLRAKSALVDTDVTNKKGEQARKLIIAQSEAEIAELRINKAIETTARLVGIKESEIKSLLALVKEGTLAELELNKALIRTQAEQQRDQIKATVKNKEEADAKIKQIDAETKRALLDADKAFAIKQVELAQKRADDQQKISDTLLARFNKDQEKRISKDQDVIATRLANSKAGSKEEHQAVLDGIENDRSAQIQAANGNADTIARINAEANRKISDENERFGKAQVENILNVTGQIAGLLNTILDAQSAQMFAELDKQQAAAVKSAGTNADLRERIEEQYAKKRAALEKQDAERKQKYAIIQAVISGALAVVEAAPNIPLQILAGLTALAQIAVIRAQQFADGGVAGFVSRYVSDQKGAYISSGPGNSRSDSIPAKISVGESIVNARSTHMFYDQLSAMNVAGGGRPFPGAGTGGEVPQMSGFSGGGVPNAYGDQQLANMIEIAVSNALANQPPVLVTSDLHKVQSDQNRLGRRVQVSLSE